MSSINNRFLLAALLAAVALGTMVLTVAGGLAVSAVGFFGASPKAAATAPLPSPPPENLRGELNSALAPELPFNFDAVGNPTADKSGVALAAGKTGGSLPSVAVTTAPVNQLVPVNQSVSDSRVVRFPKNTLLKPGEAMVAPPLDPNGYPSPLPNSQLPLSGTSELLKERRRQIKLGQEVAPLASYYRIDELRPYGVVGSGNRNQVKLFAPATGTRFSVSGGTRFRDGTIEAIGDEGVSFRRDNGEVVFYRWMKNQGKKSEDSPADAPLLRVERTANPPVLKKYPL